jgi:NAD(P)-dependent dehydrogenase (short-subunit alcohol dehydrogenase family)
VGRDADALREVVRQACALGAESFGHRADLARREDIDLLAEELLTRLDRLDILVHSAGVIALGAIEDSLYERMDFHYSVNVAAPLALTKLLLPPLERARGEIVFVNSSLGMHAKAGAAEYGATKHALKALADSLRQEVNERGVRVLSVYPGKTATRMQERLHREEGVPYAPETLLQPEDVAEIVQSALSLQRTAEVTDIHIRGMRK